MKSFLMNIPNPLSIDEAIIRIKKLLKETEEKNADSFTELKEYWQDNVGNFDFVIGIHEISATLIVREKEIILDVSMPPSAFFFKEEIEKFIEKKAEKLFS